MITLIFGLIVLLVFIVVFAAELGKDDNDDKW